MKKMEDSKRSGAGADEIYTPTLWYFELLLFTIDQELPTPSISNIEEEETENPVEGTSQELQEETEDDGNNTQVIFYIHLYLLKTQSIYKLSFSFG
jgi:hypothetical protein